MKTRFVWKRVLACVLLSASSVNTYGADAEKRVLASQSMKSVMQLKPGKWVVMGSSTAFGAGAPRGKGWVALLGAEYTTSGAEVVNIAKGGTVTYTGLSTRALRVARRPRPEPRVNIDAALSLEPVLLIVSYPTNDTALGYDVSETVNNLLAIRAQAQAAGAAVIVTSTQPRNMNDGQLDQLRTIDEKLAASVGACFVEVRQALAGDDGRLEPTYDIGDGVHPNKAGHAIIAEKIRELIESEQCVRVMHS